MGAVFIIIKVGAVIKYGVCRFTRTSFLYACPGVSPQRRRARIIAQSYPVRTAIQLSRIAESEYPPSSLDKGVGKYTRVVEKSIRFFLQDRNVPLNITTGTEKSICTKVFSPTYQVVTKKAKLAKDFPSTFQVVTDFRFCTKVFAFLPLHFFIGTEKIEIADLFFGFHKSFTFASLHFSNGHFFETVYQTFFRTTKVPSKRKQEGTRSTV